MVALSGAGWRLAPSLVAMVDEANRLAPARSRISDGSIGNAAHAARSSFHNPSGGIVDAVDLTHDPVRGWDAHRRARQIVARGDSRLDHVISNRQIWSVINPFWPAYDEMNPHKTHAHIAVKRGAAGRVGTGVWWPRVAVPTAAPKPIPIPPEDDEMFSYEYVSNGAVTLVVVDGGKQTRLTGQAMLAQRQGKASHFKVSDDDVDRLNANYGSAR